MILFIRMAHECSENHTQSQIDLDVCLCHGIWGHLLVLELTDLWLFPRKHCLTWQQSPCPKLFRPYMSQNVIKASNRRKQKALFSTNPAVTRCFQREIPRTTSQKLIYNCFTDFLNLLEITTIQLTKNDLMNMTFNPLSMQISIVEKILQLCFYNCLYFLFWFLFSLLFI